MTRRRPPDRLDQLVECAVQVFTERGYRRTQMADVARALGVAPGTLYLYVESKEALFDLVVRRAFTPNPEPIENLPLPTPKPGTTLRHLRDRMLDETRLPTLRAALARSRVKDPNAELEAVVRELYTMIASQWRGVKLLDRSALDWPELAAIYFDEVRRPLIADLERYLRRCAKRGILRHIPDFEVAARVILESIAWFALHRYTDPSATAIKDEPAVTTIATILSHGLLKE